jgi:hypothetical protein
VHIASALALLALMPAAAVAEQLTPDAIEAMVIRLDQEDAASQERAESQWGVDLPDDTVFVLRRESLDQHAGMDLEAVENLMASLRRHGVAARWCQATCPTQGGDHRISITSFLATRSGLFVEAEISGHHRRVSKPASFDDQWGLRGWFQRANFSLQQEDGG